jgi:hypothetical protein
VKKLAGNPPRNYRLGCSVSAITPTTVFGSSLSEYLISGDKHLLKLGSFRGVKIVKTVEFLALRRSK